MAIELMIDINVENTLRNIVAAEKEMSESLKTAVKETTTVAAKEMRSMLRPHKHTGNMAKSIRQKIVRPKSIQPFTPLDKGLFRTVKPRGRKGVVSNFFDRAGTRTTPALNWRSRARATARADFEGKIESIVNERRDL